MHTTKRQQGPRARFSEALSQANVPAFLDVLKKMNLSIDLQDDRGRTFLWHAVNRLPTNKTAFILRCGGDPSMADDQGVTPLQIALQRGNLVAARLLLDYPSTNPAYKGLQDGPKLNDLLLHHTGSFQDTNFLKMILDLGANVNIRNRDSETPLIKESRIGHQEAIEMLLGRHDVDLHAKDRDESTALYLAVFRNNLPLVSCMLEAKHLPLDPNILGDGRWSLLGAAAYQGLYDMAKLLLGVKGIRINAVDKGEDDPLWLAIQTRSRSVVGLFLSERTRLDINCQNNKSGDTYLLAAARDGELHLVDLILRSKGVDLYARNQRGESALKVCRHHKHPHVFQRLASLGAVY